MRCEYYVRATHHGDVMDLIAAEDELREALTGHRGTVEAARAVGARLAPHHVKQEPPAKKRRQRSSLDDGEGVFGMT